MRRTLAQGTLGKTIAIVLGIAMVAPLLTFQALIGLCLLLLAPFAVWELKRRFGVAPNRRVFLGDLSLGIVAFAAGCIILLGSGYLIEEGLLKTLLEAILFLLLFLSVLYGARHGRWLRK